MTMVLRAAAEAQPGEKWRRIFSESWPAYKTWFLSEGALARPTYARSRKALVRHMPELVSTYDTLVELAGGTDLVARFLSLYCPPPYISGCSQAAWAREGEAALVRNNDYTASLWDSTLLRTSFLRPAIAMSDCGWGLLDGMNDAGLTISLAFGGRRVVGEGFGIPLILRYALELCTTAEDAVEAIAKVPVHMAYNVTVLDRAGSFSTVEVAPDRAATVHARPYATNHQGEVQWQEHAAATRTLEREELLAKHLTAPDETLTTFIERFRAPPLYSEAHERGRGTLYTAVYRPASGEVEYLWPSARWRGSFEEFPEGELVLPF
jgi:predicted choloylglycine hydrolase